MIHSMTGYAAASADITWTVHLANSKAAHPNRGNDPTGDLVIDPGSRTLTGPDQQQLFDTGSIRFTGQQAVSVPLGEIRTDLTLVKVASLADAIGALESLQQGADDRVPRC